MNEVHAGQQHTIVASRADGAVGLFYARDPHNWLASIGTHVQLEDVDVRPSAAAVRVIEQLRARFAFAHLPSAALPWYLIDHAQVIATLEEFDLESGELKRVAMHTPVMVMPQRDRGTVMGYTRGGQIVVKLESSPHVANIVIAARTSVKPILRASALTWGAT